MRLRQLGLFTAAELRDAALERVELEPFKTQIAAFIPTLPRGLYTGEQIRLAAERAEIYPHHHNAWGAVIRSAIKAGSLIPTSSWVPMEASKSHARMTRVYRRG
jgi:hypothetical protein